MPTPKAYDAILAAIAGLVREARSRRPGLRRRSASARRARPRPGPVCGATPISSPATASRLPAGSERGSSAALSVSRTTPIALRLSEAYDGAGAGHAVVACFTIGTALGGGLVIDGKLRHGPNNEAAEFGHTPMPWPNESEWPLLPCFCGKAGCVEQYVSGTGLARDYAKATGERSEGTRDRRQGARRRRPGESGDRSPGRPAGEAHRGDRQRGRSRYFRDRRRALGFAGTGGGTGLARRPLHFLWRCRRSRWRAPSMARKAASEVRRGCGASSRSLFLAPPSGRGCITPSPTCGSSRSGRRRR